MIFQTTKRITYTMCTYFKNTNSTHFNFDSEIQIEIFYEKILCVASESKKLWFLLKKISLYYHSIFLIGPKLYKNQVN